MRLLPPSPPPDHLWDLVLQEESGNCQIRTRHVQCIIYYFGVSTLRLPRQLRHYFWVPTFPRVAFLPMGSGFLSVLQRIAAYSMCRWWDWEQPQTHCYSSFSPSVEEEVRRGSMRRRVMHSAACWTSHDAVNTHRGRRRATNELHRRSATCYVKHDWVEPAETQFWGGCVFTLKGLISVRDTSVHQKITTRTKDGKLLLLTET